MSREAPKKRCPCCDYVTLLGVGDHEICPVCFWQYDLTDGDRNKPSSANHGLTINEARANFSRLGACSEDMVPNVLRPADRAAFVRRPRGSRSRGG